MAKCKHGGISEFEDDADARMTLMQMTLKVADVSHSVRPFALHEQWSRLVQGKTAGSDVQREAGEGVGY